MNTFEMIGSAFVGAALGFVGGGLYGCYLDRKSEAPISAVLIVAPMGAVAGALVGIVYGLAIS